eukprot:TRINITY_DN673_c0_g2_i4.p2 TRINITY_DN673_c0_g2~~TRINITY_DN673_c0_g2_i4.p2  ORF type:complete len:260 (+),score=65.68 TRINITY_DN673_c0_g2_i4:93-872(+)
MTLVSCVVFFSLIVVASASYAEKKYKDMQYKDFKKLPEKPGFKVIEEENLIDKLEKSDLFEKFAEAGGQADAISEEFQDSKYKMYYGNRDKQIRETFTMADADKKKLRSSFLGGAIAEGGDVGEVSVTGTSLAGITDSKSDEKTYSKYNQFKKVPDTYVEYEEYKVYEPKPYKSYDYNPYHGKKYYDEYKMPYDYDKKYYDEYKMPYGYDKKYYDEYKMPYGYDKKCYDEQWPDFGCEGIKVQRAHQPTSQCQGKKKKW